MSEKTVELGPQVRTDCVHYRGDRPCAPHKEHGVHCPDCSHYQAQGTRILMIKLDAMGDVLRTTCVLPALARAHPGMHLTWITDAPSIPLFHRNPYVHRVLPSGSEALAHLAVTRYDLAINLDTSPRSAALQSLARASGRLGYALTDRGEVVPCDERGVAWLKMGLFDDLKKANTRTYQDLMHEIMGLDGSGARYILELDESETRWAKEFLASAGVLPVGRPLVGLNTGAGGRWQYKRWTFDGYLQLIHDLKDKLAVDVILLGGQDEQEFNETLIRAAHTRVYQSGVLPLRRFSAVVGECDLVVTGDTLGLHIALARGCDVVTLFGPTSRAEIELYDRGTKVAPEMDCLVCYLERCDKKPACMDLIAPRDVMLAVWKRIEGLGDWPGKPDIERVHETTPY